jgi:hypothetical protein
MPDPGVQSYNITVGDGVICNEEAGQLDLKRIG